MSQAVPPTARPAVDLSPSESTFLGHPTGLFLLFLVEMWERFSYYGMRGLLVLYLVRSMSGDENGFNPGRGWTKEEAGTLYGWYTGLAYLFPIVGGIIADKMIGTHRSMVVGGLIIALGHIVLGISGFGSMASSDAGMAVFIFGLALIVIGTGHFKPSVSVMVGQLYKQGDPRRDGAFTIFYMGINLGAFLCAFACGTLGQKVGWHWGFASAAVGMLLGLGLYLWARPKYLSGIGLPPAGKGGAAPLFVLLAIVISAAFGYLCYTRAVQNAYLTLVDSVKGPAGPYITYGTLGILLALIAWFVAIQRREDRGPTASIFIFMFFNAFFWLAFEQAGSSINLFTDERTDLHLFGWAVPSTWFQSVNAGLIFILAPLFAAIWSALGRRKMNPSQPVKIALGLIFLGLGYIFMVWGANIAKDGVTKASMMFVLMTYFWHTVGELCLSPTGLSYVTKVAPVRFVSLLMGIWFISSFIANLGGGLIAAQVENIEKGTVSLPWYKWIKFGGQADFFFLFVITSIGSGLLVLVLSPLLKKLIGGREDVAPTAAH